MRFGERYGVPKERLFATSQEMLAQVPLDVVSVTTHAPQHCENVLVAIDAGVKAVFCEKPLASSLEEADRMVAAAEKQGTITAVGTLRHWSVLWERVRSIIDSGEAGPVSHIIQHSGGSMLHTESHFFDLGRYILDNAEPAWAVGHLLGEEVVYEDGSVPDRSGHGYVCFKNGAEYFLVPQGGLCMETTVVCAKAAFRCMNDGDSMRMWVKDPESRARFVKEVPFETPEPASSMLRAVNEIVECLDNGGNTRCNFHDGLIGLEMGMAFWESHRRGNARVDWPLEDRSLRVRSR